jgi:hypothetical protein
MKKQIVLLIIGGLVIFVLGGGVGFFYEMQQVWPQLAQQALVQSQLSQNANMLKILSSKVVQFSANGIVNNINGRNITLSVVNDKLVIPISNTAKIEIYTLSTSNSNVASYQPVQFNDIKIGDRLSVGLTLSSDDKLEGQAVYIFPVPVK